MSSRGALTLLLQAARCSQSQAVIASKVSWRCPCQPALKMFYAYSSSLVHREHKTNVFLNYSNAYPRYTPTRSYAIKKGVKKNAKNQVSVSGLNELIEVETMIAGMEGAIEVMKTDFVKQLSLRSAGSLESLKVQYEGKEYELQQISKMTRKGQQTIVIDMLSFPQMSKAVADMLKTSALNLNPQQEGTTIFVPIPKVTKEHREILSKKAKALFITCRDAIKQTQEKYIKEIRTSDIPDSEKQFAYKQVKALADKYVLQSETMMKTKQEELLGK